MARNLLYLDPWSGLSGDMMLAALLDAGGQAAESALHGAVASLGLVDTAVEITHDVEWGIACTRVNVRAEQSPPLRHLSEMLEVIGRAVLSDRVKVQARAAVGRLAEVEAGIHGCPVDQIHFHEVGAADTLVDVVGTFVLIEALGVEKVYVGTIPVGGGTVEIAGNLIIGENAKVVATIAANNVQIQGTVRGDVTAKRLEILDTGKLWGNIAVESFVLDDGGFYRGQSKMQGDTEPPLLEAFHSDRDQVVDSEATVAE